MNYYLRSIFMISLSLFIFISNVMAQESSFDSDIRLNQALLKAVQSGDDTAAMEHVEYLLRSGVDVNVSDGFGRTASALAAISGNTNILELLLSKGGDTLLCFDYIIDVRPAYPDRTPGQSMTINLHEPLDGVNGSLTANYIRLELIFSLRSRINSSTVPFQVIGIGESRNFQGSFKIDVFDESIEVVDERSSDTVEDVVRNAVKDGYRGLRNALGDLSLLEQQPLRSTIRRVGEENTMLVSLGLSDYVQLDDDFYIYPARDSRESYYNNCGIARHPGTYLTRARVVEIDDNRSIMEWNPIQNGRRSVQQGDIVELDPNVDLVSRKQGNEPYLVETLQMGYIPPTFVRFINTNGAETREEVTFEIRRILFEEARNFNFRMRL